MLHNTRVVLVAAVVIGLSGCAAKGSWMGADSEKTYDKELEIKRLAEVLNNDDYYEFERDGRIYVLSDAKDYISFNKLGELTFSSKKIGGGPGGKTIVYGLIKNETKLLEKDPRSQGAAQKMYEGNLKGLEKEFFGLIEVGSTTYVFKQWTALEQFKKSGAKTGFSETSDGRKVVYVGASEKPADTSARYEKLIAQTK